MNEEKFNWEDQFPTEKLYEDWKSRGASGNRTSIYGGPQGLGDPTDSSLNESELKLGIPAEQKEIIKHEKCFAQLKEYENCRKENFIFTRFLKCSEPKRILRTCVNEWMNDPNIYEKAMKNYIQRRRIFRETEKV